MLYQRLDEFWAETKESLRRVLRETDGTPQGLTERDLAAARYSDRLAQLGAAEYGLCFGRLDFDPDANEAAQLYVGRLGIYDKEYETLLVDWRAPAARPFYLATAVSPAGVLRRRHIRTSRRRVTAIEDESLVLTDPQAPGPTSLTGETALLAALGAARTGRMGDIVETIQAEQDRIIRADVNGALVVQGGPGTGKTAVALHRAAYLLYTHRERLATRGVLVVGPNTTFLKYIEQVLPSLGETAVSLATVGTVFPGVAATEIDAAAVAARKGQIAMVKVISTAVANRQLLPSRGMTVQFEREQLTIDRPLVIQARRRARASRQPHNLARSLFISEMIAGLARQYALSLSTGVDAVEPDLGDFGDEYASSPRSLLDADDLADIRSELRADPRVQAGLNQLWPRIDPQMLLSELLGSREALVAAGLSEADAASLQRDAAAPWTVSDVPLLDEAAELLGVDDRAEKARAKRRRRAEVEYAQGVLDIIEGSRSADFEDDAEEEMLVASDLIGADTLADRQDDDAGLSTIERAAKDREWTYGHLIVDEAQELSPMAWRMLMRRCPTRSMTIVGDVAQTSDPAGTTSWGPVLAPYLGNRWTLAELTVNYRTPAEIMDLAQAVLAAIDPGLRPPESVRETGEPPWARLVDAADLAKELVREAESQTSDLAAAGGGTVAIIVADQHLTGLSAAVHGIRPGLLPAGPAAGLDLRRPLVMLTTRQAKGLEFDSVIVVEPAAILDESARGLNDLYVALTRPTQRLGVLHTQSLPAVLSGLN